MCWIIIYLLEIFLIKNLFNLLGKNLFLKIINNYELWSETLIILLLGRTSLVRRWDRCVNEERTKGTGTWDRSTDPNEIRSPLGKSWERWRGAHEMVTWSTWDGNMRSKFDYVWESITLFGGLLVWSEKCQNGRRWKLQEKGIVVCFLLLDRPEHAFQNSPKLRDDCCICLLC